MKQERDIAALLASLIMVKKVDKTPKVYSESELQVGITFSIDVLTWAMNMVSPLDEAAEAAVKKFSHFTDDQVNHIIEEMRKACAEKEAAFESQETRPPDHFAS